MSSALRLCAFEESDSDWRRGALAALSAARPAPNTDPLPEQVSRTAARCIARARDGDGAEGKSAGGPIQEAPHPQERDSRARGTECDNLDGAAPSDRPQDRQGAQIRDLVDARHAGFGCRKVAAGAQCC